MDLADERKVMHQDKVVRVAGKKVKTASAVAFFGRCNEVKVAVEAEFITPTSVLSGRSNITILYQDIGV
jgi:hypothetical protein